MFAKPSLFTRIAVAKLVGAIIGLAVFFAAPQFGVVDINLRVGILFWYITIGAFIGIAGVMTFHPILKMRMPWWFIGPWLGAWMNFILVLIGWDMFAGMMASGEFWGLTSPLWGVAEGALAGLLIAAFATLFGGEGPETARNIGR